jgi:N-dimethylarginine dimethylaminohydrolase
MTEPHILMCSPDYFGIEYEINPWMNRARPANHAVAVQQWNDLNAILKQAGAKISTLEPIEGLPDLVFTANAALIFRDLSIQSNFRHEQRAQETPINAKWFAANGFRVEYLPQPIAFEGAGDALFCGDTLFAGYQIRSHALGHQQIGELIGCRVIPLPLIDDYYYHLDTCFCPLAPGIAIYNPNAFDEQGRRVLREHIDELIPVPETEARHFACNAVVVGRTVVTNSGSRELQNSLRSNGFEPVETPLSEFVKSGGSAKCLTLRLDGEEAASWSQTVR